MRSWLESGMPTSRLEAQHREHLSSAVVRVHATDDSFSYAGIFGVAVRASAKRHGSEPVFITPYTESGV